MSSCPGLQHDDDGAGLCCPTRPGDYPEDGDWQTFCRACERSQQEQDDRAMEWEMERAGAIE